MKSGIMWSDTAQIPRLFGQVDARVAVLFFIWALHMSWITFYISAGSIAIFAVLPYFGLSLTDVIRLIKQKISGKRLRSGDQGWVYVRRCGI